MKPSRPPAPCAGEWIEQAFRVAWIALPNGKWVICQEYLARRDGRDDGLDIKIDTIVYAIGETLMPRRGHLTPPPLATRDPEQWESITTAHT